MPKSKGKKATKQQCTAAINKVKQMKDDKQIQSSLVELIKAECITEQDAQKLYAQMKGGGGGQASGRPEDMENPQYEQSHGGQRA